jgi:hypothetical protein
MTTDAHDDEHATPTLDIVIPVYNEGRNIVKVLAALQAAVTMPCRILICYDFEEDDTLRFATTGLVSLRLPLSATPDKARTAQCCPDLRQARHPISWSSRLTTITTRGSSTRWLSARARATTSSPPAASCPAAAR